MSRARSKRIGTSRAKWSRLTSPAICVRCTRAARSCPSCRKPSGGNGPQLRRNFIHLTASPECQAARMRFDHLHNRRFEDAGGLLVGLEQRLDLLTEVRLRGVVEKLGALPWRTDAQRLLEDLWIGFHHTK